MFYADDRKYISSADYAFCWCSGKNNTVSTSSFKQVFGNRRPSTSIMSSQLFTAACIKKQNVISPIQFRKSHPKKTALKRHFEQLENDKVVVEPIQSACQIAKRQKNEWDLLYNNKDNCVEAESLCQEEQSIASYCRQKKRQSFFVNGKEMKSFFHLTEDELIQDFLHRDKCMRTADKYLLAMVFAYFKRAGFKVREYTRMNFFVALYLANDMEEDEEELKYEIFPWALGPNWKDKFPRFLSKRDKLWAKIDHRAVVSRCCCDQIMTIEAGHSLWKRTRPDHHGGATRSYFKSSDDDDGYPRGPSASPKKCLDCDTDSQYDSASPFSVSWYVSSGESSPGNIEDVEFFEKPATKTTFDMKGLKKTLPNEVWPTPEQ